MNGCDNVAMILAMARDGAIGHRGGLLCHLAADLKRFKALTMGHAVIMGRKTWQSLPNGALPGRHNVVITRNPDFQAEGASVAPSLAEALALTARHEKRFIIGGASIYREALALVDTIFLTLIDADFPEADTRLPELRLEDWLTEIGDFTPADERNDFPTIFLTLHRPD